MTVTGKTLAQNVAQAQDLDFNEQKIIYPIENPLKPSGHIQILRGKFSIISSFIKIINK